MRIYAFSVTDHIWQQQPQVSLPPGVIILTHHDHHHGFPQGQFGILENVGTGSVLCIAGGYEDHKNGGVHQGPSHQIRGVLVAFLWKPTKLEVKK